MTRRELLTIVGVLLFALVCRGVYLWQFSQLPDWDQLTVDNWYHHHWAMTIAGGNVVGDTTYFRAPMYAWCLGAVYALFGASLWAARLFGLLIGVTSVLLTYLITKRLSNHRAAVIAASIHSVYPLALMFEAELLLDPLFALFVQLVVWTLLRWSEHPTVARLFFVFLVGGIAALTRPTALFFLPLIAIVALWKYRRSARVLGRYVTAVIVASTLTVGVVFARNIMVAGDPVLVASQGGINFYIGNNDDADGLSAVMPEPLGHNWRLQDITYIAERSAGKALKPGEVSSYWAKRAVDWIVNHPLKFVNLTIRRIWFSVSNSEIANNRTMSALVDRVSILRWNPISFGLIFVLAAVGAGAYWRTVRPVRWIVIGMLGFILVNSLFFVNSRFRLPLIPLYIALAGMAVEYVLRSYRSCRRDRTLLLVTVVAATITFAPIPRLSTGISTHDLLSKGLMFYNRGDYTTALDYYRVAAKTNGTFPETNLNIGAALLKLGHVDSATMYLEREIELHPGRSLGYSSLAAVKLIQHEFVEARRLAAMSLSRRPYDQTAWIITIRAMAQDSSSTADSLYTLCRVAAVATKNSPRVCAEGGAALDEKRYSDGAIELFRLAAESKEPPLEMDDRMFERGYFLAVEKSHQDRARSEMSLGSLFGRRDEFAQSALHSSAAISLDSTLSGAWVNLVSANMSLGRTSEALRILNQARQKFPDNQLLKSLATRLTP